jgi:HSP20 family protein
MMLPTRRRPTAVLRNFPDARWDADRLFEELLGRPFVTMGPGGPEADFYETEDDFVLEMNLPGFDLDEVEVNLEQGVLSISGEHSAEREEKGTYHLRERGWSRFTRSFSVPHSIDPESVDASFHRGVLTVKLPKAAEAKPRRIEIKGS